MPRDNNMTKTKIFSVYHNMKYRCYNPNCHAYKDYGGRNITICDDWLGESGFMTFYNWAIINGYHEGLSIDRTNENGNYEPDNCQWITLEENVAKANKTNKRRKAVKGTYYGVSPDNKRYEFDNASEFARQHNLIANKIRVFANGRGFTHKKWKFGFVNDKGQ